MQILMTNYNWVLYCDNNSYTDYSVSMRDWTANNMGAVLTLNEDYIYVGADHTFASRFVKIGTANTTNSVLTVQYYAGTTNSWRAVKNLRDGTSSAGKALAQDGFISWDLPSDWVKNQVNSLPELEYNESTGDGHGLYWIRIKSSATLSATTAIRWLGLIWTDQNMILKRWAEATQTRYLPPDKTDWYELIELSTYEVGDDLNIMNVIDYELQAKDINELGNLTALKTIVNILTPMQSSETLKAKLDYYEGLYQKALKVRLKGIDTDKSEVVDKNEKTPMVNTRIHRT